MTIKTIQKVIKVGSSVGITLPAKDLKYADIQPGDLIEVSIQKQRVKAEDAEVVAAAKQILDRYNQDFDNLAKR